MEYTLRIPNAMAGDVIPLFIVADAMARSDASGRGTLPLHGPTLRERRPTRNAQLVAAAKNGTLIVCNSEGVATSAGALIHAAGFPTDLLTVGPSGKVHQFKEIDALFVRSKHLNDWSQKDGDVFHVIDMPVQVVEFGPQNERGEFAFRGMVSLPGADDTQPQVAPQAGNDAPEVGAPASETLPVIAAPMKAGPGWSLKTSIERAPGYRWALYQTLQGAHLAGQPCPKARDVLEAWKRKPPLDVQVGRSRYAEQFPASAPRSILRIHALNFEA